MMFSYPRLPDDLTLEMLTMPVEELAKVSRYPLRVFPTRSELYTWMARLMAEEIKANNREGQLTRWILPVGPKDQYPLLAEITNRERISWRNVWSFHMDEYLDWEGRPVPENHPFSFRGYCQKNLYRLIDPELRPPGGPNRLSFDLRYRRFQPKTRVGRRGRYHLRWFWLSRTGGIQ